MLRAIIDWLDGRALERAVAGYESEYPTSRAAFMRVPRGTLREVIRRLRGPEANMSPGEILTLLALILELLTDLAGAVDAIVERIRQRKKGV